MDFIDEGISDSSHFFLRCFTFFSISRKILDIVGSNSQLVFAWIDRRDLSLQAPVHQIRQLSRLQLVNLPTIGHDSDHISIEIILGLGNEFIANIDWNGCCILSVWTKIETSDIV